MGSGFSAHSRFSKTTGTSSSRARAQEIIVARMHADRGGLGAAPTVLNAHCASLAETRFTWSILG